MKTTCEKCGYTAADEQFGEDCPNCSDGCIPVYYPAEPTTLKQLAGFADLVLVWNKQKKCYERIRLQSAIKTDRVCNRRNCRGDLYCVEIIHDPKRVPLFVLHCGSNHRHRYHVVGIDNEHLIRANMGRWDRVPEVMKNAI